ncbi:unnamed protein product, partial [marine sediment metagenome]
MNQRDKIKDLKTDLKTDLKEHHLEIVPVYLNWFEQPTTKSSSSDLYVKAEYNISLAKITYENEKITIVGLQEPPQYD